MKYSILWSKKQRDTHMDYPHVITDTLSFETIIMFLLDDTTLVHIINILIITY